MKLSANQIQKGMTIKVTNIFDSTQGLLNMINDVKGWGTHTLEEKKGYQAKLDNNHVLGIPRGTIKKDSPTLEVYDIDFNNSYSYQGNDRVVTINSIMLKTDKGNIIISTRQKVELIK